MLFFLLLNVVGILTLMSRKIFMLSGVEHEIFIITAGPDFIRVMARVRVLNLSSMVNLVAVVPFFNFLI